jgi:hypothetical protein
VGRSTCERCASSPAVVVVGWRHLRSDRRTNRGADRGTWARDGLLATSGALNVHPQCGARGSLLLMSEVERLFSIQQAHSYELQVVWGIDTKKRRHVGIVVRPGAVDVLTHGSVLQRWQGGCRRPDHACSQVSGDLGDCSSYASLSRGQRSFVDRHVTRGDRRHLRLQREPIALSAPLESHFAALEQAANGSTDVWVLRAASDTIGAPSCTRSSRAADARSSGPDRASEPVSRSSAERTSSSTAGSSARSHTWPPGTAT